MNPHSHGHSAQQLPPRIDHWPVAMQHAMRLRGAFVPCGPGMRGVGWPDNPAVRLHALAPWLSETHIASHLTAAWVWGAARSPGWPLQVIMRPNRRQPPVVSLDTRRRELRMRADDFAQFGTFAVTTPKRTVLDLLRDPAPPTRAEVVAWRLLLPLVPGHADAVEQHLRARRPPNLRIALERLGRP